MKEKLFWRLILPVVYSCILVASIVYLFIMAPHDAFCGLPAITLTLPWSILFVFAVALIAPEVFESSVMPGVVLILISGGIWIFLLWRAGRVLDRKRMGTESQTAGAKK